jgi:DNA (cytosine-5)-methyltransferase 1
MDALNETMDKTPTHLDLFSGIGGFALAAQWAGFRTIGFCEIDKYCQKVLAKNFLSQPDAFGRNGRTNDEGQAPTERARPTISSNIFDLDGRQFAGVDLITGGFPCQPFSVAGKRRGAADDRAIWPQMFRVISEARPAWILGENVPGIIPMELDNVLSDLEGIGYATRSFIIPACAVDARHRRDRLWIVGRRIIPDTNGTGSQGRHGAELPECSGERAIREGDSLADTENQRCNIGTDTEREGTENQQGRNGNIRSELGGYSRSGFCRWLSEPNVGGTFDGLSRWLDGTGLNETAKTRAVQIMRSVWCEDVAQAFQREIGRFNGVSETEVLLTFLCEYEEQSNDGWTQMEGRTVALSIVRDLWRSIESSRSPYRRKYRKQLAGEYSDALRKLPRETSSLYPQTWSNGCWEDGIARVANKIPNRVDRLKGLGNAIVPQVAYEILKEIRKLI